MSLVIALGNPLREDDGVGWAVARALGGPVDTRVLVVQQLAPELAQEVSRAGNVVFVDARRDGPAGEVRTMALAPGVAEHGLTHDLDPATLLYFAKALYGRAPKAWLVSVAGEHFGLGDALSATVERAVPEAAQLVRALVQRGC